MVIASGSGGMFTEVVNVWPTSKIIAQVPAGSTARHRDAVLRRPGSRYRPV